MINISGLEPPKNLQNLHIPLRRALASKPLNQIVKCHTILEMGSHILSDLVYDFGKGPKRGFKKID